MTKVVEGFETRSALVTTVIDGDWYRVMSHALSLDANALDGAWIARSAVLDDGRVRATFIVTPAMKAKYVERHGVSGFAEALAGDLYESAYIAIHEWEAGGNIRQMPLTLAAACDANHVTKVHWHLEMAAEIHALVKDYPDILQGIRLYRLSAIIDDEVDMGVVLTPEMKADVAGRVADGEGFDGAVFSAIFVQAWDGVFPDGCDVPAAALPDDDEIPF